MNMRKNIGTLVSAAAVLAQTTGCPHPEKQVPMPNQAPIVTVSEADGREYFVSTGEFVVDTDPSAAEKFETFNKAIIFPVARNDLENGLEFKVSAVDPDPMDSSLTATFYSLNSAVLSDADISRGTHTKYSAEWNAVLRGVNAPLGAYGVAIAEADDGWEKTRLPVIVAVGDLASHDEFYGHVNTPISPGTHLPPFNTNDNSNFNVNMNLNNNLNGNMNVNGNTNTNVNFNDNSNANQNYNVNVNDNANHNHNGNTNGNTNDNQNQQPSRLERLSDWACYALPRAIGTDTRVYKVWESGNSFDYDRGVGGVGVPQLPIDLNDPAAEGNSINHRISGAPSSVFYVAVSGSAFGLNAPMRSNFANGYNSDAFNCAHFHVLNPQPEQGITDGVYTVHVGQNLPVPPFFEPTYSETVRSVTE